jgi:hypothetical protein
MSNNPTTQRKPQPWWTHVLVMPTYKPGDLPPEGYLQWHEWAEVQRKAGIKQVECPTCSKWQTPQELSTREVRWTVSNRRGQTFERSAFQCAKCFEKDAAHVAA